MTKAETIKLLAVAVACFPSMQDRDLEPTAVAWHEMLGDLPFDQAMAALKKILATAKFFPTVAEIREAAASFLPAEVPEAETAWAEVLHRVKTVGYIGTPEWTHPLIGNVVDAMYGGWRKCCETMQVDTLGVDRAQFLKMYATMTKRHRELAQLTPDVRQLTGALAEKFALPWQRKPVPQIEQGVVEDGQPRVPGMAGQNGDGTPAGSHNVEMGAGDHGGSDVGSTQSNRTKRAAGHQ